MAVCLKASECLTSVAVYAFRLNLAKGRFLSPLPVKSPGIHENSKLVAVHSG